MIDQTISHYSIVEKVGAGGMGVVYKARDLKLERTVALKFLPDDLAINEREKEKLLREARAASALDHPNIGAIYGLEEGPDHPAFIVMAFYEGETLATLIDRRTSSLAQSLEILIQVARGLAAAHARNIVHRDIKPGNIILTSDNTVKIVDFGLARVIANSGTTQSLNTSGTLPYMAPEQILGEPVTPATDVWALGVVMVQLLTRHHPFSRENTGATTFAILNQMPTEVEALPEILKPVAYRALSKDPKKRYPSARELLGDLEAARDQMFASRASSKETEATISRITSASELKRYVEEAARPRWSSTSVTARTNRTVYVVAALFFLLLLSLFAPLMREKLLGFLPAERANHIAVLPFDTAGNDPETESVAQGLMDSLTSELSNLSSAQPSLWVVPASVVRARKVNDPTAAARELGATLVVKGSIQRSTDGVHLRIDLIDAKNLRQVGSASLEDRAGDIASLQDEAVARLARLMNIPVTADMLRVTGGTVSPAAYQAYLQALGLMQRYDKHGNLDRAVTALQSAVTTDPRFALGYAQLAEAFRLKYQVDVKPKWLEEAKANGQKALELDDRLPSVYVTLGRINELSGNHDLALQQFQHAVALDPRSPTALAGVARSHEAAGRIADAEASFKQAAALRPDYWDGYEELGLFYDRQGRYPEAIEQLRRVVQLTPDNAQAFSNLGAIYIDAGDPKYLPDAEMALKKSLELSPSYPAYANLGALLANQRRFPEAAADFEKALEINSENYLVWTWLVNAYEWMSEKEKAAIALEKALSLASREVALKPRDALAHVTLASLSAKKQLRDKALTNLQTALILAPDDPDILEDAAATYELLGDRARAVESAEKALLKGYSLEHMKSDADLRAVLADPKFNPNPR